MREPQPGDVITASLRLVRPLGAGGMGAVWVAWHEGLRTEVVVKLISAELSRNPDALARFSREAAAASQVRSPHVVTMLDHGVTADGQPYIAMELLEGESLRARLDRERALNPQDVVRIVSHCAKALEKAHAAGVVHRDIKPDNIFLLDSGGDLFVKVLDFGIAKTGGAADLAHTKTGSMLGTPHYMSPEQVMGSKMIDHRTDLWALGIVAYEALTGARPFDADTIGAISVMICHGEMRGPSIVRPGLPAAIDHWFSRACARDVIARFSSARELSAAFEAALNGQVATVSGVPLRTEISGEYAAAPPWAPATSPGGTLLMTTTSSPATSTTPDTRTPRRGVPVALVLAGIIVLGAVVGGVAALAVRPSTVAAPATAPGAAEPELVESKSTAHKLKAIGTQADEPPLAATPSVSASSTHATDPAAKPTPQPPPAAAAKPLATVPTIAPAPIPPAVTPKPAKPQANDPNIF